VDAFLVIELLSILLSLQVLRVIRQASYKPFLECLPRNTLSLEAQHFSRHLFAGVRVDFNLSRLVDLERRHVHFVILPFADRLNVEVIFTLREVLNSVRLAVIGVGLYVAFAYFGNLIEDHVV
jgi:hypothetical protein